MSYYYLAASLPLLSPEGDPPMSFQRFRDLCAEQLRPRDLRALDQIAGPGAAGRAAHPFVRAWRHAETRLRNAVARVRASRLQRDPAPFLREEDGSESSLETLVAEALSRPEPLRRERALDRLRWARIEHLAGFDPFSAESILSYALKLRLLERWAAMNDEEGSRRLESLLERRPDGSREAEHADAMTED